MLGYIEYDENTKTVRMEKKTVLGGRFLALTVGREVRGVMGKLRVERAAKQMREQGVHQAVFPVDFPYTAMFLRRGILPADPLPLRRSICAAYVMRRLSELAIPPERGVIAIGGEYLNREMRETTLALAVAFRYVMLAVPEGGEELARELRRIYGISLLIKPSRDQLERADALVLFAPRGDLSCENRVFCALYPGGEFTRGRVPAELTGEWIRSLPPNCDREQLAAALYAMGQLTAETLFGENG